MLIDNKFDLGDIVYLKTDPDQKERLVTGVTVRPTGLLYELSVGEEDSTHYDLEITTEKDVLKTLE